MPSLKSFDIAVLINMSRDVPRNAQPFVFSDTILTKIRDRARPNILPVEALRIQRPDLHWFTDLCAPHASVCAYSIDFHPMRRNLWIADVNPLRQKVET
jgi:hypothetical protein